MPLITICRRCNSFHTQLWISNIEIMEAKMLPAKMIINLSAARKGLIAVGPDFFYLHNWQTAPLLPKKTLSFRSGQIKKLD